MGTVINLSVGTIDLTWSKNHPGTDHGRLFHESDRVMYKDPDYEVDEEEIYEGVPMFRTTLGAVLPRIELLGHTLERAAAEYDLAVELLTELARDYAEDDGQPFVPPNYLSFDEIRNLISRIDVANLSAEFDFDKDPPTAALVAPLAVLERLPWWEQEFHHREFDARSLYSESVSAEYVLGGFDPYTALRLLAENPKNLDCPVIWDYGHLCQSGYADEAEFNPGLDDRDTFLIVTEGSSDAAMIRHAIDLLRPTCTDFFRYIDMEKGYPFAGTGELHKFIQGFIAMRVPLNVIAIYDNDAEGYSGFLKTSSLSLRPTYRVTRLPDLATLATFPAAGPAGELPCDINRRAAAMEAYLDLTRKGLPPVVIDWGGMNKSVSLQQGALRSKTHFMKDFLGYKGTPDRRGPYDLSGVEAVVDMIFRTCVDISDKSGQALVRKRKR